MSSTTLRKRLRDSQDFRLSELSDEENDSDMEVIPVKRKKSPVPDTPYQRLVKSNIISVYHWLEKPLLKRFLKSVLISLGHRENDYFVDDAVESDHSSDRIDSPYPTEQSRRTMSHPSGSKGNLPKISLFNKNPMDVHHKAKLGNISELIRTQKQEALEGKPPVVKTVNNSLSRLAKYSILTDTEKWLPVRDKAQPSDVEFISESPAKEVIMVSRKAIKPNSILAQNSKNSNFTAKDVQDQQQKEMYKVLIETCSGGSWRSKYPQSSFKNSEAQVSENDIKQESQMDCSIIDLYMDQNLGSKTRFVRKVDRMNRPKPTEGADPKKGEITIDDETDEEDEIILFTEKPKKRLQIPDTDKYDFFSPQWLKALSESIHEQTTENLNLITRQEEYIAECRKKKLQERGLLPAERPVAKAEDFPEFTDEMEQVIEKALYPFPEQEVLSQVEQQHVLRKDMDTLQNQKWLNDEIINFYMVLIMERCKERKDLPSTYAFNSFFYPRLKSKGFSGVARWTRKLDVFSYDILLVPLHLGVHWCLAVIDLRSKKLQYYDSMEGKEICLQVLKDYLHCESLDKKKKELDMSDWTMEIMKDIPPQMNGFDCGMFTLKYAEYYARDSPFTFTQEHMQYFRKKMVYEIMNKKIL